MSTQSNTPELLVKAADTDAELRLANDLMAKTHRPVYFESLRWFENAGAAYPGFLREHTRLAMAGDELAGALRITTDTIRIGEARLKMGGVAWVSTAPGHRRRGVATMMMGDALRYMGEHRYHVSMLFGIPDFYRQFGYATALADYSITIDASEAALAAPGPARKSRGIKPGDIAAIQKIHAANDQDVPCSLLRDAAHFTNKWERLKDAEVVTDVNGKVVAYARIVGDGDRLSVEECGVLSMRECAAVMALCAARARDRYAGRISFLLPPAHPLARYLLQYTSVHETHLVRERGGMMAFVNIGETLENMIPEWEGRIIRGPLRDSRIELTLLVDRVPHRVRAHRGAIDIAQMAGKNKVGLTECDLMQMLTGYRLVDDLLGQRRRLLTEDARALLDAIFPKRDPYVWSLDRF